MPRKYNSQRAYDTRQANLQRDHEFRIAMVKAFAADPELKYYLGVALGSVTAVISAVFSGTVGAAPDDVPTTTEKIYGKYYWLVPGAAGAVVGEKVSNGESYDQAFSSVIGDIIPSWNDGGSSGPAGFMGVMPNFAVMAGTGFAGFCAAVLMLKAIFGDEDVAPLLASVAEGVDAVIPL